MSALNGVLWHQYVLYTLLGTGILFLLWSKLSPFTSFIHGIQVVRGKYDKKDDPGAISHFEALSAALSATVGLGNIGGVALAISLGGPGAVFWMWIVGLVGMSLKTAEVTMTMLYRNTDDPDNPKGGPMYVASLGFAEMNPKLAGFGKLVGGIFCVTLIISAITGGNMFQAWNVADVTAQYTGMNGFVTGIILAFATGAVIIGGIKRIGSVAGKLVPVMCGFYLIAALIVIVINIGQVPSIFALIFNSAFSDTEAQGAFLGGTAGMAFIFGMKRALFSNEAGQGSAPIAHAAAKSNEPVREGVVAGLEPFIDTICVCTLTALVILGSGAWNRSADTILDTSVQFSQTTQETWTAADTPLTAEPYVGSWNDGQQIFGYYNNEAGVKTRYKGSVEIADGATIAKWDVITAASQPMPIDNGVFVSYTGASLTSHAFNRVVPGLGMLIPIAAWLFAISTMISWSYYGEQGIIYLLGTKAVLPYKLIYCGFILVATSGFIKSGDDLDNLISFGTGVMLFANIPIMWVFGNKAMKAYHVYMGKVKAGDFDQA
jgi:AGCS family alanine or glycine:cation symporter